MIAEFAIEPRVMAKWSHFHSLHDDFGVPRGRFLVRYPGEWAKEVALLAHQFTHDMTNTPVNAKRIEEHLFSEAFKRKVVPARRPFDKGKSWLANAAGLEGEQKFQAIVAERKPDDNESVVVACDFLKTEAPYYVETGEKVLRTAEELAACARPLLKVSEELVLVDPHFRVRDQRGRPISRFLATVHELLELRRQMPQPLKRCELHVRRPDDAAVGYLRHDFERRLSREMPRGFALTVFFWTARASGEELHPRFLLTEYGGIQYDYGLDEGRLGETTIVSLLSDSLWRQLRQDYSKSGKTFAIDLTRDVFVVKGE